MSNFFRTSPTLFVLFALVILSAPFSHAYVASSSSYRLELDSVNGGGGLSTSTTYRMEDTVGEAGVGTSSSASYAIQAGYQQMNQSFLSISAPGPVTLAPNIPSVSGGTADGFSSWTVTTNSSTGYTMSMLASSSPALVSGGNSFADYVTAGADPDFTFTTPLAASRFGFSPEGTDIVQKFKDNGVACNAGVLDTGSACWGPMSSITPTPIASRVTSNYPVGTLTTIRFRAVSGASNVQPAGSYMATATLTVIAN